MAHEMQQRYEARLERRRADVWGLVAQLTEAAMRQLLERLALRSPSLMFDVLDAIEKEETGDPDNERHHPTESVSSWCSCTNCRHMPTAAERVCCRMQPRNCVSSRIQFEMLVLDEGVLAVADQHRADMLAGVVRLDNDGRRHAAYRQYILWRHGRLGQGNRRVIPSCCVWAVRDRYPSEDGHYRGYVAARYV